MKKYLLLTSFFIFSLFFLTNLKTVAAQNYDNYCTGGCCWESTGGNATFYSGCHDYGSWCGGTGNTSPNYCRCRNDNPSYAGECKCDLNYNKGDNSGPSCAYAANTWGYCRQAKYSDGTAVACKKNSDCVNYGSPGAYSGDICYVDSTTNCKVQEPPWVLGCCYYGSDCGGGGGTGPTNTPPVIAPPTSVPPTSTPSPTPSPTPTPRVIAVNINVFRASSAAYNNSTSSCTTSASSVTPYNQSAKVSLNYESQPTQTKTQATGLFSFTVSGVETSKQLTINIDPLDNNYSCLCPNGCTYALTVPAVGTNVISRNIYLSNFTDSWWQVVGGNAFVNGMLKSIVPDHLCTSPTCLAGVFLPLPSQSAFTSGFPFLHGTNLNSISTHQNATENLANIHLSGQRTNSQSADGLVLGFTPTDLNYNYFYQLATNNGTINNVTSLDLAQWRADTNHNTQGLTIFKLPTGDQTINQNNNLFVQNGERVVIFVDGNLTIENNPFVSGQKITTVNQGGFLGIFVSGDIIIEPNVGTALDTGNPANITPVTLSNTHLNGVFFSDGTLTIEGDTSYPNYKFIGAGTFIGKTSVTLGRQTNDDTKIHNSYQALESFIYRPDLLVNWPNELKSSIINWREVAPKSLN